MKQDLVLVNSNNSPVGGGLIIQQSYREEPDKK
jgi:hypothetical protein